MEDKLLLPAFNEIKDGLFLEDCILVSPSYIQNRDEQELQYLRIIEELKIKKDVP